MRATPAPQSALPHGAIFGLGLTQIIGWGTTYYVPSVLAPSFRKDLGLAQEAVFAGVSIMLLVSAAIAPSVGRRIEAHGARGALMLGSLLMTLALVILSCAQGLVSYALAWLVVGIAAPLALSQGPLSALAQIAGNGARTAISRFLLVSGFASTAFWPLTAWSEGAIGWRGTCLVFAACNLLLCLPIHALVVPSLASTRAASPAAAPLGPALRLTREAERFALILAGLTFSLAGFVSSGLGVQIVELLSAFGHTSATAVAAGALVGPAAVAARAGEATIGQRAGILAVGVVALAAMPIALALPLFDSRSVAVALAFIVGYGMSAGAMTIVRSVVPLALFGRERYARLLGNLAVPQNVVFALAPTIFAGVLSSFGPGAALLLAVGSATLALAAMLGLVAIVRRAGGGS